MSNQLSDRVRRRCSYLLISSAAALSVSVGTPAPAQAISWFDLIFQGVQLIQLSNVSERQEAQIGQQINGQLLKQGMKLHTDSGINQYVNQVGQRLAAKVNSDRTYKFQVVKDKSVNAFATTGGYVYVTTGLLKAADNEAQLASVIGHEMGHIESRHLIEQMQQTALSRGLITAAGLDRNQAANIGAELAINRPRSRQDEYEADQAGLKFLRDAGYAESAAPEFMKKLAKQGSSVPTFLSTHPAPPDRVEALEAATRSDDRSCTQACGLDNAFYKQKVRDRIASK